MKHIVLSAGLALGLLWLSGLSLGTVQGPSIIYYVAPGGNCAAGISPCYDNLQAAVDAAEPGGEIRVAAGVYTSVHARAGLTQVVYLTKTVTIRGGYTTTFADPPDPEANPTTLDAQGQGRVIYIAGNISPTVEGVHITGGNAAGLAGYDDQVAIFDAGGGVYVITATAAISNSLVFSNSAQLGGGVYLFESNTVLSDNSIIANSANAGGAVFIYQSTVTLTANIIAANSVREMGGGMFLLLASTALHANVITSNTAEVVGGAYLVGGKATFIDNVISANLGGGVRLDISSAIFESNVISANIGLHGSGVWLSRSSGTLIANTIVSNKGWWEGGGVYCGEAGYMAGHLLNPEVRSPDEPPVDVATASLQTGGRDRLAPPAEALTLIGNTIVSNTANNGGGIFVGLGCAARLDNNTILSNVANNEGGGVRGGENIYAATVLTNNLIAYNAARDGGGVYGADTLTGNTISGNTASVNGGGIHGGYTTGTLDSNVIADNTAIYGGGMYGRGTLVNNVFAGNRAGQAGGGLYLIGPSRLTHNTLAHNDGSGIHVAAGPASLVNTILVSHSVGLTVTAGQTATLKGTLWGADEWANGADWGGAGTVLSDTRNYWSAPDFLAPQDGDYHLRYTSPAIDAGPDAGVADDMDGDTRPVGSGYDLGADEFRPVVAIELVKQVIPNLARPGQPLTYTIHITNVGNIPLHAIVTDTLPAHIIPGATPDGTAFLPGGLITWTGLNLLPAQVWAQGLVVTSEADYVGPLVNVVQVTAWEGASAVYTVTSFVRPPNYAPYPPSNPSPADGASDVSLNPVLTWQGGDPDGQALTYTLAFGASSPPPVVAAALTVSRFEPGRLEAGTTYYWGITATDGLSTSVGATWSFSTVSAHRIYLPVVLRE